MSEGRLSEQDVLVIGGSSGIGLAVARTAQSEGAQVTIAGRDEGRLRRAAETLDEPQIVALDARDPKAVRAYFEAAASFDHIVCTMHSTVGGTLPSILTRLATMDLAAAREFAEGKWWSQLHVAREAPRALRQGGSLTLTSGAASSAPLADHSLIGPVNCAIDGLVPKVAKELAPSRVNSVSPGLVKTPAYDRLSNEARAAMYDEFAAQLPAGWVAEASDIAKAYVFLMDAAYVTGCVLPIDGGVHVVSVL